MARRHARSPPSDRWMTKILNVRPSQERSAAPMTGHAIELRSSPDSQKPIFALSCGTKITRAKKSLKRKSKRTRANNALSLDVQTHRTRLADRQRSAGLNLGIAWLKQGRHGAPAPESPLLIKFYCPFVAIPDTGCVGADRVVRCVCAPFGDLARSAVDHCSAFLRHTCTTVA